MGPMSCASPKLNFKGFWEGTDDSITKIYQIAANLKTKKPWIKIVDLSGSNYNEIGRKENFDLGVENRWGSKIDEVSFYSKDQFSTFSMNNGEIKNPKQISHPIHNNKP